jgi:hypothetical protein
MPAPITQADLRFLACPVCHGTLRLDENPVAAAIVCETCRRRFPIVDGLPILLAARARLRD